jgi:hypothetical protein
MRLTETSKGKGPVSARFARGGKELTSRSRFMKTPDQFTGGREVTKESHPTRQDYGGKKDPLADQEGDTKKLKPIKPRT